MIISGIDTKDWKSKVKPVEWKSGIINHNETTEVILPIVPLEKEPTENMKTIFNIHKTHKRRFGVELGIKGFVSTADDGIKPTEISYDKKITIRTDPVMKIIVEGDIYGIEISPEVAREIHVSDKSITNSNFSRLEKIANTQVSKFK